MNNEQTISFLMKLTDWCMAHKGRNCLPLATRESMYRYVAFCWLTGRMSVAFTATNDFETVVFYWTDWKEHIESKADNGKQQFPGSVTGKGDSLFLAEVIGSRKGVARIYQQLIEKYPNVITVPVFTFRKGKLVELSRNKIEQFVTGKEKI